MIEQINNENFKAWIFWFIDSIKNYDKNFPNQTLLSKVALTTSKKSSRAAEITISNSSLVLKYCIFIIVQFPLTDYIHLSIRCIKIGKFWLKQLFFLTTHSYSDKDTSMQQLFLLLGKKKVKKWPPFSHLLASIDEKTVGVKVKNWNWSWSGEEWQLSTITGGRNAQERDKGLYSKYHQEVILKRVRMTKLWSN